MTAAEIKLEQKLVPRVRCSCGAISHVVLGEDYADICNFKLEMLLSTESLMCYCVKTWKVRMLYKMQTIEAWLVKLQREALTIGAFLSYI